MTLLHATARRAERPIKQARQRTGELLTVSIDSADDSKKFLQKLQERSPGDYDFPFLEDKGHKVIDRYGILNPTGKGWPYPSTYVIDPQGVVRWRFVETSAAKRSTNEQIMAEIRQIK